MLTDEQKAVLALFVDGVVSHPLNQLVLEDMGLTLDVLAQHHDCCTNNGSPGTKMGDTESVRLFCEHHPWLPEEVRDFMLNRCAARVLVNAL